MTKYVSNNKKIQTNSATYNDAYYDLRIGLTLCLMLILSSGSCKHLFINDIMYLYLICIHETVKTKTVGLQFIRKCYCLKLHFKSGPLSFPFGSSNISPYSCASYMSQCFSTGEL